MSSLFLVIIIGAMIVGFAVQSRLRNRFKKYSQIAIENGLTGADVARRMLDHYGLSHVQITSVPGRLTDHYNPANQTVNLSQDVYHGSSVASAAVAAHECGHAVQHAQKYAWLQMRSKMVPVVNMSGQIMNFVFIASFLGMGLLGLGYDQLLIVLIATQAVIATFAVVTLPVEYDASRRALVWLRGSGVTHAGNHRYAEDALKWAARTYLVAAITAVVTLLYYVLRLMGSRD